ncbi:hypothetical protein ILYODFUR_036250 [Ilyodon furcidens]|uniref:Laminin IV type A domain-containing protein n=1 Tax=Ilyodon furcidens TaxID=33524 RepID=A0ABV0UE12_9TELE
MFPPLSVDETLFCCQVTAYGGELRYTVSFEPYRRSLVVDGHPDVVIQGNNIFLEHYSQTKTSPRVPNAVTVTFRESSWRRIDGQPCTRENLLMALADVSLFMIRATYVDSITETSISDIKMDIAVPHLTGKERALEVEECACPLGYRGASCQVDVQITSVLKNVANNCNSTECFTVLPQDIIS